MKQIFRIKVSDGSGRQTIGRVYEGPDGVHVGVLEMTPIRWDGSFELVEMDNVDVHVYEDDEAVPDKLPDVPRKDGVLPSGLTPEEVIQRIRGMVEDEETIPSGLTEAEVIRRARGMSNWEDES